MTASLIDTTHPHRPVALVPLLAAPLRLVSQPEGLLQIHTAPFRGSFAAVFSQALRTAGLGSRVLVSQFLKGGVEQGPAGRLRLCGRLEWLRPGTPHCLDGPPGSQGADGATAEEALEAVEEVWDHSRQRLLAPSAVAHGRSSGAPHAQSRGTLVQPTRHLKRSRCKE